MEDASAVAPWGQPAGPCPAGPPGGEYGGRAMRLRLGRARRLGGWSEPGNQAKGGEAS